MGSLFATVTVTPPVDVAEYIAAGATVLGTVVAAAVLAKMGFVVVRLALTWARSFAR